MEFRAGAERYAAAVPVDIRGTFGPSASSINGIYEPTPEVCGGWPVYRKQGDPDKWLEYIVATNEWCDSNASNASDFSLVVISFV